MYHKESYREEEVDINIVDFRERRDNNIVVAKVSTSYGSSKIAYGFPKGQGWHEKLNGTEKYLLKLKDLALDELKPDEESNPEMDEKNSMEEAKMSERKQV